MLEPKILQNFFEEHHKRLKKRAYTTLQFTCGSHAIHSDYGEWLRRKANENSTTQASRPSLKHHRAD
jgi:hypothetical protein